MKLVFSKKNIINSIFGILLILVWLLPVSENEGVLNTSLNNRMYILILVLVLFMLLYDWGKSKKKDSKNLGLFLIAFSSLIIFSILGMIIYPNAEIGLREASIYFVLLIILSYQFTNVEPTNVWRSIFYLISTMIAILGILMLLGSDYIWSFFSTYYVNHTSYNYTVFRKQGKPITFFAAHSISCYIYFLLYLIWEICEASKNNKIAIIFKGIYLILIIGCQSNSAILCVILIISYYLFKYIKELTLKRLLMIFIITFAGMIFCYSYYDVLINILGAKANGVLGRFSKGTGALINNINYIIEGKMPTGIVFAPGLFYTDCGMLTYMLRGSFILPVCIYVLLFRCLKYYIEQDYEFKFLFLSIVAFEVGYPILIAQRFVPIFIFFLLYVKQFGGSIIPKDNK